MCYIKIGKFDRLCQGASWRHVHHMCHKPCTLLYLTSIDDLPGRSCEHAPHLIAIGASEVAPMAGNVQVLKNSTEMYSEKDLYVGKVLSVHQRTFELLEADEFTYQYMENNRHVYLMADWEAALKAIQAQLQGIP